MTLRPSLTLALACVAACASGPGRALPLPTVAPRLLGIDTSGSETAGFAAPLQPLIAPVTQLRLRFDQPLAGGPGVGVDSPANYRVVAAGADGVFSTAACNVPAAGDDVAVTVLEAAWSSSLNEATLRLDAPSGLRRGAYRVLACDSLLGLGGLALDGDGNGLPGGIALRPFDVLESAWLANPGFDRDFAGWQATSPAPAPFTATHAPLDADEAAASGALRVSGAAQSTVLLANAACVVLQQTGASFSTTAWRGRLRYRVLEGRVRLILTAGFGFAGDQGEPQCIGPGIDRRFSYTVAASDDFATIDTGWNEVTPFPLAQMTVTVVGLDNLPFEVLLDDVGLSFDTRVLFRAGFE